jgi:valyl-tRNA synthetase
VSIHPLDETAQSILQNPTTRPSIVSLAGKAVSDVTLLSLSDSTPTGSAVYTVGSSATVFLDVKGRIDIDKEIAKASDRLKKANDTVEKQKKIMDDEWEQKVGDATKEQERERLKAVESEARNWQASIEQFERLKLE